MEKTEMMATIDKAEFRGKVVLISGAAQGIGAAVARAMYLGGAGLALLDRQSDKLQLLLDEFAAAAPDGSVRPLALTADVSLSNEVNAAVGRVERELGAIDILINVAGILRMGEVTTISDEDWEQSMAVNTGGVFRLSRAVAQRMLPRRCGVIVTVGSNAAATPRMGMAAYAASKAASMQFTRCLALELAPYGIRCNSVSPGSTDTEMQRQLWSAPDDAGAVIRGRLDQYRLGIPLGRIASADDIAQSICFLASDRARHITMHDLRVDGGATLDAR
ncbi:2,3-dihydro-2,3-dihydroxybenzoate dehydrogenase [Herbaspirillum lusitanum]|uniref:2,3-dihydro-2,3-dihydroxybenzoate dehydrogenase n=1 Tax=Herbaspirillum lusitanum TaxID=213312 RepID=A0ABW9ACR4_9BURK